MHVFWLDIALIAAGILFGCFSRRVDVFGFKFLVLLVGGLASMVVGHLPSAQWQEVSCGNAFFDAVMPCYTARPHFGVARDPHMVSVMGFAMFCGCLAAILRRLVKRA